MANELRVRANGVAGALSSGVAIAGVSMSSAGLADLPVIDTTNHAALTLFTTDADGRVTKEEIVYVTAHTAAATTATIVKAKESTTDQAWSTADRWVHAPTARDWKAGSSAKAHTGAAQSIPASTWTAVALGTNDFDDIGIHSTTVNNTRFTIPVGYAGRWEFAGMLQYNSSTSSRTYYTSIRKNGTTFLSTFALGCSIAGSSISPPVVIALDNAAEGDYYELMAFEDDTAAQALSTAATSNWMYAKFIEPYGL